METLIISKDTEEAKYDGLYTDSFFTIADDTTDLIGLKTWVVETHSRESFDCVLSGSIHNIQRLGYEIVDIKYSTTSTNADPDNYHTEERYSAIIMYKPVV